MSSKFSNQSDNAELDNLFSKAREFMATGLVQQAERSCQAVLAIDAGHAGALMGLAQLALNDGDRARAAALLEKAIQANREMAEPWYRLGVLQWADRQVQNANASFSQAVSLAPQLAKGWLKLGMARLAMNENEPAAEAFQQALLLEPGLRVADKDSRLPESIRAEISDANRVLRKHYKDMSAQTLARTRARFPDSDLGRFEDAFRILQGEKDRRYCHPLQRPAFLLFPDMPAKPWFEREEFEWVERVEDATPQIREELQALLAARSDFQPYIRGVAPGKDAISYSGEDFSSLANSQSWNSFHLNNAGVIEENASRCPKTMSVLDSLPLAQARAYMPEIFFSVLQPGAHIIPHYGQMNIRLTVHLGLVIPDNCGLRAGDETRQWREGQLLIFDDSFEHEAWNRGDSDRVVLIFEIWNPALSEAEIAGLQDFFEARGEWMSRFRKPGLAKG